ncbi:MAG: hypothetical protein A3J10_03655 [Candidatus Sungbacteria bacterium RIFCSPLOWO2_02_FULL_54_10]|uniref:Uncharacterized protein n=2 Tax=Candidatus Sungiibacteriota TaxID=1817917 RepID=A0A1G2L721_9BACT|nr:MAG: hypothetical protein A2679_02135 [Candidatus Sungbacteria bacterium RIFCSPHIGHO2_01_FULL_54_26]OHA02687.1 MAG: hypothetical protein A3C92_02595 [Candidatus Sungbacteria bacterium RIFCSPHIGHO2_02_FULL_53_17]OHA06539.1 MAG: hypothetical protein A3B34_01330 [Candidatus Sungbacteria bacterium RIFCSPLOWO2_01_FULL_54_21]OHA11917.1 MAG: hypothetical protein A3J10_03655 [Candidatus Sungbacteria bacterium RIFCSPLOWO2_02_FULL_54_10]HXK38906.1 hypothetical protein [Candidatus Paceibacterota bacter
MPTDPQQVDYAESVADWRTKADVLETTEPNIPAPKWNSDVFFKQRNFQRAFLFHFSWIASSVSLLFLYGVVVMQIIFRARVDPYFEVMSDQGLDIFAVAVFGQVFGIVYIIARSVWSNDEFNLMKK